MALPKLNDTPKYNIDIPSTGNMVRYRPFLVKEEKVLLLAMESQQEDQILSAILDTIEACVVDDIDIHKLTTFDIEYLFTKIRSKSVGETSTVMIQCEHCQSDNEVIIPIDEIGVHREKEVPSVIDMQEGLQLEMKYPSYSEISKDPDIKSDDIGVQLFAMIRKCLKAILTEEERIDLSSEDPKEIDDFIESMSTAQFTKVREFVENIPVMSHDVKFGCTACGLENNQTLRGMQSFF